MSFLAFFLNTAQEVADKPTSDYFLPKVLESIEGDNKHGKLLPIEKDHWSIGPIGGTPGQTITTAFQNNWLTFLEKVKKVNLSGQVAIPNPSTPNPVLNLGGAQDEKIEIIGLENVKVNDAKVLTSTNSGYTAKITLQFNQWDKANSGTDYPTLRVSTPYTMSQKLCLADTGKKVCNGNASTDIDGNGTVIIDVSDALVDVDVTTGISGTGANRAINATITKMTLHGTDGNSNPTFDIAELTIGANVSRFLLSVWENAARKAILSNEGSSGIFQQLSNALNDSSNLSSLSNTITTQLHSILDDIFSPVKSGDLPSHKSQPGVNSVDQYIVDRASYALNTLGSHWYLPQVICSLKNPQLEPLTESKIDLPNLDLSSIGITAKDVSLSNVVITGLSNLLTPADQMVFKPNNLHFIATLGKLDPPPKLSCNCKGIPAPPTTLTGDFNLSIEGVALKGSMVITLTLPELTSSVDSAGNTINTLDITVKSSTVGFSDLDNMKIDLDIDSEFKAFINSALNTKNIKGSILGKVNDALADNLGSISSAITQQVRSIISSKIN